MTGIRRNIDRALAETNTDTYRMMLAEQEWLMTLPPELRDAYLKEQEGLTTKLNNMIWYGNEEGKKDE